MKQDDMTVQGKLSESKAIIEKLWQKATLIYKMADRPSQVRALALQMKEMLR